MCLSASLCCEQRVAELSNNTYEPDYRTINTLSGLFRYLNTAIIVARQRFCTIDRWLRLKKKRLITFSAASTSLLSDDISVNAKLCNRNKNRKNHVGLAAVHCRVFCRGALDERFSDTRSAAVDRHERY